MRRPPSLFALYCEASGLCLLIQGHAAPGAAATVLWRASGVALAPGLQGRRQAPRRARPGLAEPPLRARRRQPAMALHALLGEAQVPRGPARAEARTPGGRRAASR